MFTDNTLIPIQDNAPYTAQDGTKYPWNWDKTTISGLFPVTVVDRPADTATAIVTDVVIHNIGGVHTQVWNTRGLTVDELAAQAAVIAAAPRNAILSQIAALEAQQTPRRMREALKDATFINSLDAQIATLRGKL